MKTLQKALGLLLCASSFLTAQAGSYLSKGVDALRNGDEEEAMKFFRMDLQTDPTNGFDYLYLGRIFSHSEQNSNYPAAFKCYVLADKLLPASAKEDRSYLHYWTAHLFDVMEDTTKIIEQYTKAIALQPKESDFYVDRGWYYYLTNNNKAAEADFKKAIALDKNNAGAYRHYGVLCLDMKEYDKAIAQFQKSIETDKDTSLYSSRSGLGVCYYNKKDYTKMAEAYGNAIEAGGWSQVDDELMKYSPEVVAYMHPVIEAKRKEHKDDAMWPFMDAVCYSYEQKKIDELKALNEALLIEDVSTFYNLKAKALRYLGVYDEAMKVCKKGLEIDSTHYGLLMTCVALNRIKENNGKETKAAADTMLSRVPYKVQSYTSMGIAYRTLNDYESAAKWYNKAYILSNATDNFTLYARSYCQMLAGKKAQAKEGFEEYLKKDTAMSSTNVAYAYARIGNFAKVKQCIDTLQAGIKKQSKYDDYFDIACLYSIMNEKDKAIENLRLYFEKWGPDYRTAEIDKDLENICQSAEYKAVIEDAKKKAAENAKIVAEMNKGTKQ